MSGRWILLGFVALTMVCGALSMFIGVVSLEEADGVKAFCASLYAVLLIFTGGLLLISHTADRDLQVRFPSHLYTLPVAPRKLVLTRLAYNLVAFSSVTCAGFLVLKAFHLIEANLGDLVPIVAGFAFFQAICWFFGGIRLSTAVVAMIVLWMPVGLFLVWATNWSWLSEIPAANVWVYSAFLALTMVVAVLGVHFDRQGVWEVALSKLSRVSTPVALRRGSLSPARAQLWFEWRNRGSLFPLITVVMTIIVFCMLYLGTRDAPLSPHAPMVVLAIYSIFLAPILAACMTGVLMLVQDFRVRGSGRSSFVLTYPISDRLLARSRLYAGNLSVALIFLPVAVGVLLVVWLSLDVSPANLLRTFGDYLMSPDQSLDDTVFAMVWVAWWYVFVCLTMVWLAVPIASLPFVTMATASVPYLLFGGGESIGHFFSYVLAVFAALAVTASYYLVWRRGLVSTRGVVWLLGAFVLLHLVTVQLGEGAGAFRGITDLGKHLAVGAALLVALAPIATVRLTVAGLRHR